MMLAAGRRMSRFAPMAAARLLAAPAAPLPSTLRFVAARGFARPSSAAAPAASKDPDAGLVKALKAQLEHEKGDFDKEISKFKPPAPFTMENKPGMQEVILRRTYGSEDISVSCVFSLSPYEDEGMDEEDEENEDRDEPTSQEEVRMLVTIAKEGDGPVLEISCTCSQGEIEIHKVSHLESKSSKKNDDDDMLYGGPEFEELEEELQSKFSQYLDRRGINEDLCKFLINFMPEKDRHEYILWLEKVANFIRK